jgi:hypothetical protein
VKSSSRLNKNLHDEPHRDLEIGLFMGNRIKKYRGRWLEICKD